jgi:dipeptidyl aminopeptidase/acylaminoacyl peptidase
VTCGVFVVSFQPWFGAYTGAMRLLLLPLAAALAVTGSAQTVVQKRPMTFADLQAMKRVSDPQISPSGKWVLFSVTDVSLEKNSKVNHLWVVGLGDGGGKEADSSAALRNGKNKELGNDEERQLTSGTGESNGRFSPDGKWVMYSSKETGSGQIWMAPWDDTAGVMGAGHQVTSLETEADGGVWAPDSKHFLFVSEVYPECESHAAIGVARNEEEANCNAAKDVVAAKSPVKAMLFTSLLYRHWDHYQGAKRSHIFYGSVEAGAGAPTDLTPASVIGDHVAPTFSLGGPLGYAISPDGREVAYVVNLDKSPAESTNNEIYTVQVGAEPSTAKKVSTSPGSDDGPAYSTDGKWLAWRSQARNGYESDKFDLVVMDRATGGLKDLTTKFDDWVDEFIWSPDSRGVVFAFPDEGEESVAGVDVYSNEENPGPQMHSYEGELGGLIFVPNSANLVGTQMFVDRATELFANGVRPLTHINDALFAELDLPKMESFC